MMKLLFIILLFFVILSSTAQNSDTLYMNNCNQKTNKSECSYYLIIKQSYNNPKLLDLIEFYSSGKLKRECSYFSNKKKVTTDNIFKLIENKKIYLLGKEICYYESGKVKSERHFESIDNITKNVLFMKNGDTIFTAVNSKSVAPEYSGGFNQIYKTIESQLTSFNNSLDKNLFGTVQIGFVVSKEGNVTDVEIFKYVNPIVDKEALKLFYLLDQKWNPGMNNGIPVNFKMILPIKFGNNF